MLFVYVLNASADVSIADESPLMQHNVYDERLLTLDDIPSMLNLMPSTAKSFDIFYDRCL